MTKRDLRFLQIDRLLSEESLNQDPEMILMKKERRVALFRLLPAFFTNKQLKDISAAFGFYDGGRKRIKINYDRLNAALKSFNLLTPKNHYKLQQMKKLKQAQQQ